MEENYQATVRPPPTQLPSSLRAIFGDETPAEPDPWRIGAPMSHRDAPAPPPSNSPPPAAPTGPRERRDRRQDSADSTAMSVAGNEARNSAGFVFPHRTRAQRRKAAAEPKRPPPISTDEDTPEESVMDLRFLSGFSDEPDTSLDTVTPPARKQITPSARENRPFKIPPNIEVPAHDSDVGVDRQRSDGSTPGSGSTDDSNTPQSSRHFSGRQRSLSGAGSISSAARPGLATSGQDVNLASPAAFHFPPNGKGDQTPSPSRLDSNNNRSPGYGSHSPGAHQATYSLDTAPQRLRPSELRSPPPPVTPTRSTTMLPGGHNAAARDSPLIPPIKPFARMGRERSASGSDSSGIATMGTPGLKDVMKVCSRSFFFVAVQRLMNILDPLAIIRYGNDRSSTSVTVSYRSLSTNVLPDPYSSCQYCHCPGSEPIFPRCCLSRLQIGLSPQIDFFSSAVRSICYHWQNFLT